jgi:hypothetical protein
MGIFDRLFGRRSESRNDSQQRSGPRHSSGDADRPASSAQVTDEQAIERYRYLLRTAPPEATEQAHAEAFAQLTPEQRHQVLEGLSRELPPQERTDREDPRSLARMATRAELRQPGTLERTFGGTYPGGAGIGPGGFLAYDLLSTISGVVIGTAIADAIFDEGDQGDSGGPDGAGDQDADATDAGYDGGDTGYDDSGDPGFDAAGDVDSIDFDGGDFGGGEI